MGLQRAEALRILSFDCYMNRVLAGQHKGDEYVLELKQSPTFVGKDCANVEILSVPIDCLVDISNGKGDMMKRFHVSHILFICLRYCLQFGSPSLLEAKKNNAALLRYSVRPHNVVHRRWICVRSGLLMELSTNLDRYFDGFVGKSYRRKIRKIWSDMRNLKLTGPWSVHEIEQYFAQKTIPLRLSVISRAGWPVVLSLWYLFEDGVFKCATRRNAKVVDMIDGNPRCGLEVAGETLPYHGVRGQGVATIDEQNGAAMLERLADRYIGQKETPFRRWLLAGTHDEVAITITPIRLMSWDYRDRMTDP